MRVRGERECTDCGTQWSYYETGAVTCPNCGSLRSVGVSERERHTAGPVPFDLTEARELADAGNRAEAARSAASACAEYVRRRGFVRGGELLELDDTYLAANELRHVADVWKRALRVSDEAEIYVLSLLGGADRGERPEPETVPEPMRAARGLAYADAVRTYRREVGAYLGDDPNPEAAAVSGTLAEHVKRVQALDGDVDPRSAETLVRVARDVGRAIREDNDGALVVARDRLDRLARR